ncbi:MAG: cytochrome-b5 reductase [Balneolia bacterium]|nr:cytochrome-b5 reductase [Balneolia bacterium]
MKPGTTVFLEGPFGSFVPEPDSNLFLIMGGIGVTPAMSMLRTMRDDKDKRKAILIFANETYDDIIFLHELEELSREINLEIIHVLEKAADDWEGERGLIDEELLSRYIPENPEEFMFFICGPGPLMDVSSIALHDLGVAWNHIYMERFSIV